MDQNLIHEPPATEGSVVIAVEDAHEVVPQLTAQEIAALRLWLAHMEKIAAICPIAGRALSRR